MDLAAVSSRLAEKILPRQHSPRLAQELVVVLALPVPIRQQRSTVGCFTPGRSSSFPPSAHHAGVPGSHPALDLSRSVKGGQSVQPPLPSPPPFRPFPDSGQAGEALDQAFLIKSVSLALFGVSVSLVSTLTLILTSSTLPKVFGRFLPFSPRRPSRLEFLASPCLANNTCSPARQVFWIFENASLLLASLIDSSDLKTSSFSTRPFIQPLSHSAIDRSIHYHACCAGYSFL